MNGPPLRSGVDSVPRINTQRSPLPVGRTGRQVRLRSRKLNLLLVVVLGCCYERSCSFLFFAWIIACLHKMEGYDRAARVLQQEKLLPTIAEMEQ